MSEELLKAIIQLLAIVAKEDQVTDDERETIEKFLIENLNREESHKYMKLFDELTVGVPNSPPDNIDEKAEIVNITKNVNQEFTTQQKVVVMLVLMELIMADGVITDREDELLYYIGDAFNVPKEEIDEIKNYVVYNDKANLSSHDILIIDNGDNDKPPKSKHITASQLDGFIAILRIKSAELYFLKYLGSEVLTLNGIAIQRSQNISVLSQGSTIRGNKVLPIYFSDIVSAFRDDAVESPISFVAENISFKFKNGAIGLRKINIAESGGKLIGLMGGSGAGKSTLLNVLNGNETPSEGSVRINGVDIHKKKKKIEGVIGYVPQDDLLMEDLTVFQNLYFAAKLCFSQLSKEDLEKLVNKTLSSLGLSETRDLRVGSPLDKTISGGQRKRLNIGLELLREPSVMFVDEPTSGLSSRDSENIMDLLKELSLKGKMIFVVIHQPSSDIFKMFDKMVILDVGGYQIYYGNPVEAVTYFKTIVNMVDKEVGSCMTCGNVNPEQIFNIIETKVVNEYGKFTDQRKISPEDWNEYFEQKIKVNSVEEHSEKPKVTLSIPNKIKQAIIFTTRDVKSKLNDTQYLIINLLEAPVLALLLAYIVRYFPGESEGEYWFAKNENIPAFFFMSVIVALFMGLTVSAEEIIKDRKILKRESFLNLSRLSYIFSKLLILFTLSALQTIMFVLIGNLILGIENMVLSYWVILFSISCFANVLGLNVSSAFNNAVTIYILIPLLLIPQLILSGVVVSFDKLNPQISTEDKVPLIGELMASRWAFEALMVTSFKDNPYQSQIYDVEKRMANAEYKTTYYIPTLESHLDYINQNLSITDNKNQVARKLVILKNEIEKELAIIGRQNFPQADQLTIDNYSANLFEPTKDFLRALKKVYSNRYNKASTERDQFMRQMDPDQKSYFDQAKNRYANEQIRFFVRNTATKERISEQEDGLIRKIYPIYMDPQPSNPLDFREQFYYPSKHLLGVFYDTKVFNVMVIWSMSIILILMLYYDVLRKLVEGFSLPKRKK